ncbi:hypothetical protein [Sphingomonas crusticola]|uniref:hypothetical protein n=1 Tax=Sphingomonas crusticola TaxID=1697973 RepID=UPI000E289567|nr:hypothetical protein [Sphingomonas crusticola]
MISPGDLARGTAARNLQAMHASQIQSLILARLVRSSGGTRQHWRRAIGEIRVYSMKTHPHCNWDVYAAGNAADVKAVNAAVDEIRMDHPHITG